MKHINSPWLIEGRLVKTPEQILLDVNETLHAAWELTGYKAMPVKLRLPPTHFAAVASHTTCCSCGASILTWLQKHTLANAFSGNPLEVMPDIDLLPGHMAVIYDGSEALEPFFTGGI